MPFRPWIVGMVLGAALAAAASARAQDYAAGLQAYDRGDYATAEREFAPLARQGDPGAQYWFGRMHAEGHGVPQDLVAAHAWYDLAAAQGHRDAAIARDQLVARMSATELADARTRAQAIGQPGTFVDRAPARVPTAEGQRLARAELRELQRELDRLGFEPGPNDGILGSRTRGAVREFQEALGRPVTGEPSRELLATARGLAPRDVATPPAALTEEERRLPTPFVESIRDELAKHGYAPGPGPGVSAELRRAIRAYQRDAGMEVTGLASQTLLDHLMFATPQVYAR